MPRKLFRILLAAFLIVAVPLQGIAAVGAGICRDLQHAQHDAGHGYLPQASQAMAQDHGATHSSHAMPVDENSQPESTSAHCAACASCGVVAGIVSAPALSLPDSPDRDAIAHAVRAFDGVVPDGIDRPPLTPLA